MNIYVESMQFKRLIFFEMSKIAGLFSQFHGLPNISLFEMLDGHLMHLIGKKNPLSLTLFFSCYDL